MTSVLVQFPYAPYIHIEVKTSAYMLGSCGCRVLSGMRVRAHLLWNYVSKIIRQPGIQHDVAQVFNQLFGNLPGSDTCKCYTSSGKLRCLFPPVKECERHWLFDPKQNYNEVD